MHYISSINIQLLHPLLSSEATPLSNVLAMGKYFPDFSTAFSLIDYNRNRMLSSVVWKQYLSLIHSSSAPVASFPASKSYSLRAHSLDPNRYR